MSRQSHAVRVHAAGGPEALRYERIDVPAPSGGQVLIRQAAAGVNFLDTVVRAGGMPFPFPLVPGFEGAGVVEAVGADVEGFRRGDRVAYHFAAGGYATDRLIGADQLVRVPDGVDLATAAAVLLKGMTVEYLVRHVHPIRAGETVLVQAVAGGVGLLLAQWAKLLGATVIGTVGSDEKVAPAQAAGADHVIVTGREDFVARVNEITGGAGVDAAFDGVGRATFVPSLGAIRPLGHAALYGWASGKVEPYDLHALGDRGLTFTAPSLRVYGADPARRDASAEAVFELVRAGKLRPGITRYPLEHAASAHADLEARRTLGSVVLLPSGRDA